MNSNTISENQESRVASLSWKERLGYGVGDAGFNFYWALIGTYLAAFYTDYLGLSAAVAGTVIAAAKIVDAFTDPVMGAIADRTNTKHGKFRPYLIWGSIPMAIAVVLAFTVPDISVEHKAIWAFVTYCLMMTCYTVLNTPYSSLSGVITGNVEERNLLVSIRFMFAFGASALIAWFTPKLVELFGRSNPESGWQLMALLYAVAATIIFFITFKLTKERVAPPAQQKTNPVQDIAELLHNRAWVILFLLALIIMITITLRGGSAFYYFKYYVDREDLVGIYASSQFIAYFAGCFATPILMRMFDKRKLLMGLMTIVGVLSVAFYFVPRDMVWLMFTLNILISLALGPKSPVTWSMYADAADFNEWRTGNRATAMTFAAATFAQKLGSTVGSVAMLGVLAYFGYQANQAQSGASLEGINFLQTAAPGIFAGIAVIVVLFYNLSNNKLEQIQADLANREN